MNYGLVRTVGAMIMIAAAASLAAGGIVNTYVFDIFAGCVDGSYGPDSNVCKYGVNIFVYMVAALFFFLGALVLTYAPKMKFGLLVKLVSFAVGFFALQVASWKFFEELGNNFLINGQVGPSGWGEYSYLLARRLDFMIIGLILGLAWWLPGALNKHSIDASKRTEPRVVLKKK